MKAPTESEILLLQDNLQPIRNAGGWTLEELGDMIGVTKQTMSNLENKKTEMSRTQYIALRAVLDYEIENNPENTVLPAALDLFLDPDKYSPEQKANVNAFISGARKSGMDSAAIVAGIASLVGVAIATLAATAGTGSSKNWLSKLLNTKIVITK